MTTATAPTPRADAPEVLEAIRQETAAAVRSAVLQAFGVGDELINPAAGDGGEPSEQVTIDRRSMDAIEATLVFDIYNARRRARRRMLGLDPVPEPSAEAVDLLRRAKAGPSASIA